MPQYPAVITTADLDGTTGFALHGSGTIGDAGQSVAIGDLNGDGYADVMIGAPANVGVTGNGAVLVYYGHAGAFTPSIDLGTISGAGGLRLNGSTAYFAWNLAAGDLNGDGVDDLALTNVDTSVHVLYGSKSGITGVMAEAALTGSVGATMTGPVGVGTSLAIGDINKDGRQDLLVGGSDASPGAVNFAGSAWMLAGTGANYGAGIDVKAAAAFAMDGAKINQTVGTAMGAGDVNGDGYEDIVIGAAGAGANGQGAAYVVFGAKTMPASLATTALTGTNGFSVTGTNLHGELGLAVAVGDVNGDGYSDILLGSPNQSGDSSANAYLIFGKASGFAASLSTGALDGSNGFRLTAGAGTFGGAVSMADVNGDGFDDMIVANTHDATFSGTVYVVFGKASGWSSTVNAATLPVADAFQFQGKNAGFMGSSLATGDVNGDGLPDILAGALAENSDHGAAYVLFARTPDTAVNRTGGAAAQTMTGGELNDTISALAGDDKLYGKGGIDLLIGGAGNDRIDGGAGVDTASYTAAAAGVTVSLMTQNVAQNTVGDGTDTLIAIENLVGSGFADSLRGDATDNTIDGLNGDDLIDLSDGGVDKATGGAGNDAFLFGAAWTSADVVDAGTGANDQVGVQGAYTGGKAISLTTTQITGVEVFAVLPGGDYDITTSNSLVAAGQYFTVYGGSLGSGDDLTVNGAAQTTTNLITYGGSGADKVTGGGGDDGFYFGPGKFANATDVVAGGSGTNDQLALDGSYTLTLSGTNISGIEVIAFLQNPSLATNTYNITTADSLVGAGANMIIYGVQVTNGLVFNGAVESNGKFQVFGGSGNDTIATGAGADWILAGAGADDLTGGAGADTFVYSAVSESASTSFDTIHGFVFASDRLDLTGAHDAYGYVSSGALSSGSFNADLTAALAGMTANQANFFDPTSGTYAGSHFLVVDGNGVAGYQAGADWVFRFDVAAPTNPPPDFII